MRLETLYSIFVSNDFFSTCANEIPFFNHEDRRSIDKHKHGRWWAVVFGIVNKLETRDKNQRAKANTRLIDKTDGPRGNVQRRNYISVNQNVSAARGQLRGSVAWLDVPENLARADVRCSSNCKHSRARARIIMSFIHGIHSGAARVSVRRSVRCARKTWWIALFILGSHAWAFLTLDWPIDRASFFFFCIVGKFILFWENQTSSLTVISLLVMITQPQPHDNPSCIYMRSLYT